MEEALVTDVEVVALEIVVEVAAVEEVVEEALVTDEEVVPALIEEDLEASEEAVVVAVEALVMTCLVKV